MPIGRRNAALARQRAAAAETPVEEIKPVVKKATAKKKPAKKNSVEALTPFVLLNFATAPH